MIFKEVINTMNSFMEDQDLIALAEEHKKYDNGITYSAEDAYNG